MNFQEYYEANVQLYIHYTYIDVVI